MGQVEGLARNTNPSFLQTVMDWSSVKKHASLSKHTGDEAARTLTLTMQRANWFGCRGGENVPHTSPRPRFMALSLHLGRISPQEKGLLLWGVYFC